MGNTKENESTKGAKEKAKAKTAKEKEKNAGSASSSESMDVAPSPAPPPPHPFILQTPQQSPQRAERDEQHEHREIVVSDQLSTPSPNPTAHKFVKKRLGHYGHDDEEDEEDEQCTISE